MKKTLYIIFFYLISPFIIQSDVYTQNHDTFTKTRLVKSDDELTDMVFIKGGRFDMGGKFRFYDVRPVHQVYVNDFYIDRFEVTNAKFVKFLNAYRSNIVKEGEYAGQTLVVEYPDLVVKMNNVWQVSEGFENLPIVLVTWYGANEYAKFYGMRLPTEAEWEYAARGGNMSKNYDYSGSNNPQKVGWFLDNSKGYHHFVGQKEPNELGLYDMNGNVAEWCSDWYDSDYYKISPDNNPSGPDSGFYGFYRVIRGASWNKYYSNTQVTSRSWALPLATTADIGFRCVMDAK